MGNSPAKEEEAREPAAAAAAAPSSPKTAETQTQTQTQTAETQTQTQTVTASAETQTQVQTAQSKEEVEVEADAADAAPMPASANDDNGAAAPAALSTDAACQVLLDAVAKDGTIEDLRVFADAANADYDALVGAAKRLESLGALSGEMLPKQSIALTPEGVEVSQKGSPEARLLEAVASAPSSAVPRVDVMKDGFGGLSAAEIKIGFAQAMRGGLLALDKKTQTVSPGKKSGESGSESATNTDTVRDLLLTSPLDALSPSDLASLKKRKLVAAKQTVVLCHVGKGVSFVPRVADLPSVLADLTYDSLSRGEWKTAQFKPFNFSARGIAPSGGHLHPLMKVRSEYREVFLEMGFEEMPTNNFVESGFWNFDTLFQPQQHPARDAHDTFFLTAPESAKLTEDGIDTEYVARVRDMHEKGGAGSIGWRYDWSLSESAKNILRTHTTAVSSRMLYALARQEGGFAPKKYFSIDRVFRNEDVDATHLAEFHQIEGLVADYDLTLGNLMGVIEQFFTRLGVKNLRFKPAYNPYTEPSMEVFAFHAGLGKWVEIGNSGVFRPEMLAPMGLPPNVRVIAWGLSLERPTMIKYGISNIRELVGHKISLDFIKQNPMCRLDQDDE
jgi:phenylalanyl-tRNA synthetase alpha chain